MKSVLIPLFGSFAIHSFGLSIVCGLAIFAWCIFNDERGKKYVSAGQLADIIFVGVIAALVGGRILAVLGDPVMRGEPIIEWLKIWDGGLSSLGCVISVMIVLPWYLYSHGIALLPLLDLIAVYAPIIHIFVRIGCFLAGCCFGRPTDYVWGIVYHDEHGLAPCDISLHPTQLYSVTALCFIFIAMLWLRKNNPRPGMVAAWYLIATNIERFSVDFFRGDQEFITLSYMHILSLHQWLSLGLIVCGIGMFAWIQTKRSMLRRS